MNHYVYLITRTGTILFPHDTLASAQERYDRLDGDERPHGLIRLRMTTGEIRQYAQKYLPAPVSEASNPDRVPAGLTDSQAIGKQRRPLQLANGTVFWTTF